MSNYNSLKATINANIKTNGNQEITGSVLNSVLTAMVNSLGAGFQFMGVATPSTNPGTPDQKVFYLAWATGTYQNFGGIVLDGKRVVVLKYETSWTKDDPGIGSAELLTDLSNKILPISVIGNELLTTSRNLESDTYVEVSNGQIRSHSGWTCYVIPVTPGKTYSYKPVGVPPSTYNYALFLLDSSRQAVKAYGANTSLPAIQALNGVDFPSDNQYGFKEITIPEGVSYVVFNKDLTFQGSPVFFEGVAASYSDAFIDAINNKRIIADNGVTANEKSIIDFLGGLIETRSENAFKFPAAAITPTLSYSGYNSRYAVIIAPDFEHSGILGKVVFSTAATAAYTFSYAIFKKVYTNGEVSSLTQIRTGAVSVPSGATEIDFSSLNIEMKSDYLLGFYAGSAALKNPMKYANDNNNGYPLWTVYSGGTIVYNNKVTIDFNYTIQYKELNIEDEEEESLGDANIVVLGDSITWLGGDDCNGRQTPSRGWTTYFKNKVLPNSIASYARSGATWSHTANTQYDITEETGSLSDDNVIYNQINRLLSAVNGGTQVVPDLIIIAAGTNDAWYPNARPDALSVDADTEFANTDGYITSQAVNTLTSIAAAMRYDIELLKTNFPNCQIIVATPLQATAFTLTRCFDVGKVIKDCAKYLSVECIDQAADGGIYRAQEKTAYLFTYDGTHTSALGARMVGQFIAQRVMSCYRGKIN